MRFEELRALIIANDNMKKMLNGDDDLYLSLRDCESLDELMKNNMTYNDLLLFLNQKYLENFILQEAIMH